MVQRFQASLSAFTAVWNYLAVIAVLFWVLFYLCTDSVCGRCRA